MRLWRAVKRGRTPCEARIATITIAVTVLRNTTAVATSTPLLKAMRAATWLAPIISAISSSVAKAAPLIARAGAGMTADIRSAAGPPQGGPSIQAVHAGVQARESQQGVGERRRHAGHLAHLLHHGDQGVELHRLAGFHVLQHGGLERAQLARDLVAV